MSYASFMHDVFVMQDGFKLYVSELLWQGIDMTILIEAEVEAFQKRLRELRHPFSIHTVDEVELETTIYGFDYGPSVEDWHLWLSNPLDEWAGEFWDMIEHPESAMPGAWNEE